MFENIIGHHKPDILDCIANLSSDEIFTPPSLANEILDLLPKNIWSDESLKFLDPCCKSGIFLREIAKRLMLGLEEKIPDESKRREHIFKNMLFGLAITELTGNITRRSLYYSKNADSKHSVIQFNSPDGNIFYKRTDHDWVRGRCSICGAAKEAFDRDLELENYAYQFIHESEISGMKFDVIIGNPPYQLRDGGGNGSSAVPIYQHFISQAKKLNPRYISMIIPSRWFAGGKGLDSFREEMLDDRRISHIVDYHDAGDCFPGVDIKGGVCYFLWDSKYSGECLITPVVKSEKKPSIRRSLNSYDVFIRFNEAISILEKVKSQKERPFSIGVSSRKPFGLDSDFDDLSENEKKGTVLIFANKKSGWTNSNNIQINQHWTQKYKVLVSKAYGAGEGWPHQIIGKPFVAPKNSACTETYLVCGVFDDENLAKNCEAYMKTKFFRFLVSLRKITQNYSKDSFAFVPNLPMNKRWTDSALYKKYSLDNHEIDFIEEMIKEIL